MNITHAVNAMDPPNLVCMPILARFQTQYLLIDRCCGFLFERGYCFEFVIGLNSLTITEAFDDFTAARATFELINEFESRLITLSANPQPYDNVRTVEVRDYCGVL